MSRFEFKSQNPDGGFPASGKPGNPSCLNDTCYSIGELIKDASKEARESLRKACEWVLSRQSKAPSWNLRNWDRSRTYLYGFVLVNLRGT